MTQWAQRPSSRDERRQAAASVLGRLDDGGSRRALREALCEVAPDFAELTLEVAYGDFWSRPGLDVRQRELVTVAALCALGRERQLAGHLRSALGAGVEREALVETLMHMAVYAGWPAAVNGLLAAREVFAAQDAAQARHAQTVGSTRVTVVSDGHAELPPALFAGDVGVERIEQVLSRHGLPTDAVRLSLNGVVLEHRGHLVVIDPGSGVPDGPHAHGLVAPTQGRFLEHFLAAGFAPSDVDLVILTHGHHDHCGGVLAADGGLTFPAARVAMSEAEYLHWRDVGDYGEAAVPQALAEGARTIGTALTSAIADRVTFLVDGEEILPGLHAVASPGHSCGQMALLLEDSGERLLFAADTMTHEVIQLAEPSSHMVVDYDAAQAVASRQQLLRRVSAEGHLVHGFHFAWPGVGTVAEGDDGAWSFSPAPVAA